MSGPHLFIDGRNCAYRAIYANQDNKYHSLVVMLRFMRTWLEQHKPRAVHVFWDAPRNTVWRRQVLAEYKDRSATRELPGRDVRQELVKVQDAAHDLFAVMNIRQYERPAQEADDLVYAACRNVHPAESIIVSSDGDFAQVPYFMSSVRLWEPRLGKWVERSAYNPVVKKALMGDVSDHINGYAGIGDVKSTQMAESAERLQAFLAGADRHVFIRNMLLIDLALCPQLLANQLYVARQMVTPLSFDKRSIIGLIGRHKLNGVYQEYDRIVLPFRALGEVVQQPASIQSQTSSVVS